MKTKKDILAEMNGLLGHMDHVLKAIGLDYVHNSKDADFAQRIKEYVDEFKTNEAKMIALELEYKAAKK